MQDEGYRVLGEGGVRRGEGYRVLGGGSEENAG